MAKKKTVKSEEEVVEELDDLEDELLDDEEVEMEFPKVEDKKEAVDDESLSELEDEEEDIEEEEEEPRFTDYKYLDLKLERGPGESDYELIVEGQSHGFLNVFVKHLLEIKGVNMAAYKVIGIEPPKVYIRLDNLKDYKIKDILYKGIESLRTKVEEIQKVFQGI